MATIQNIITIFSVPVDHGAEWPVNLLNGSAEVVAAAIVSATGTVDAARVARVAARQSLPLSLRTRSNTANQSNSHVALPALRPQLATRSQGRLVREVRDPLVCRATAVRPGVSPVGTRLPLRVAAECSSGCEAMSVLPRARCSGATVLRIRGVPSLRNVCRCGVQSIDDWRRQPASVVLVDPESIRLLFTGTDMC